MSPPVSHEDWHDDYAPTKADWDYNFENAGFRSAKAYVDGLFLGDQLGHVSGYFYAPDAQIHRYSDRLFVGAAADNPGRIDNSITPRDWLSDTTIWPVYTSQMASLSRVGATGIMGGSRTSDAANHDDLLGYTPSSIGVLGIGISDCTDNPTTTTSWGGYFEGWRLPGVNYALSFCIEIDSVNKGATINGSNPYHQNTGGGTYGIQIGSGGGQSGTGDAEAGLVFVSNTSKWTKGIIFGATSLTGTDGLNTDTGFATAIAMARNQGFAWYTTDGQAACFHYSTVTNHLQGNSIVHQDNALVFLGGGAETIAISNTGRIFMPNADPVLDMGARGATSTPGFDFHSSGGSTPDSRIVASGGAGTIGSGGIDLYAVQTYVRGQLRVSGPSYLDGALTVAGATVVAGFTATTAVVSGNTTLGGTLALTGAANLASSITAAGTGTFNGLISTGGLTAGAATLTSVGVSGAGYFATTLGVNGAATFAGTATFGGEAGFNATITANATALFNSLVAVAGVASFASTVNVSGRATFNGGLRTTGLGSYASNAAAITGGLSAGDEYLCTALSPPYKTVVQ